jgi:hypothetical protein
MSVKNYIKDLAKTNPKINPSIFLFLQVIENYSKKYGLPPFTMKEFKKMQKEFLTHVKNNNSESIIHAIILKKQIYKGGAFERLQISNEEIAETQYEALKKVFVYTLVLMSLNLFNENEIGHHLLPIYTIICISFILQALSNAGYFLEGLLILFGRKFGIFKNIASPETIITALAEPTILAELYDHENNMYLNQLKEAALDVVFHRPGLPVAQVHFPWEEFVNAENLNDLFNVEDTEEDDLPYLLEPQGGKRKKSLTKKRKEKKKRTHKRYIYI